MIILGFTGLPASGKTTLAEFGVKHGFKKYSIGDTIRELVKEAGWDPSDLIGFGKKMRAKHGRNYFLESLIKQIENEGTEKVIIDDIRLLSEDELLRKKSGRDYALVGLVAEKGERFKRQKIRGRPDDKNPEEKDEKEMRHYDLHELLNKAEILLDNNGTINDLEKKADKVFKKLEEQLNE